jgi:hypothetical protein
VRNLLPKTRTVLIAAAVAAVTVGTGVATGAIPGNDGTVTACYTTKNGTLRVIDAESGAACAKGEQQLSWNQQGPAGPAGAKGDKGDTGPQGAAACDPSRLLLCPEADLPDGETLSLSDVDAGEILRVSTFRIDCTASDPSGSTCELVLSGTPGSGSLSADAWYQQAVRGVPTARKDLVLVISDASGTKLRTFVVNGARPSALLNEGGEYQLTLKAENVHEETM